MAAAPGTGGCRGIALDEEGARLYFDQSHFAVRFDWGERGVAAIGPDCDTLVIVDVLSFSTCVDVALERGAEVLPYRWRDASAAAFADARGALLASKRSAAGFSLSPASLCLLPTGSRIVLPSPNGSAISLLAARYAATVAGCLRNAEAIGAFVSDRGGNVGVIACGERWDDGTLRPAWEDLVGAGAIMSHIRAARSPEASAAVAAYTAARGELGARMRACASGRELIERGFSEDVDLAAEYGASRSVPLLEGDTFVDRQENRMGAR